MCWTQLKTIGHSLKNLGPFRTFRPLVSQTGYEPGENHDISFEAPFTLRLAGHIDMLFFRCFCLSLVPSCCSGECCFFSSHSIACGNIFLGNNTLQCLCHKLFSHS